MISGDRGHTVVHGIAVPGMSSSPVTALVALVDDIEDSIPACGSFAVSYVLCIRALVPYLIKRYISGHFC